MRYLVIIFLLAAAYACDRAPGPDAVSSRGTLPGLSSCDCHGAVMGARRQVLGAGGDFALNPAIESHHISGSSDPTPAQCQFCHDMSQHTQGTVRLWSGDSDVVIAYDPGQPNTLEPFCLSCHDADGAAGDLSPFADGASLGTIPYAAGTTIASSWSGSSTHRDRGLTCAGTGQPDTGCHGTFSAATGTSRINMHGSTIRGLLTNTMNFQIRSATYSEYAAAPLGSSYDENNYRLCFDCHASYPQVAKEVILGFSAGGKYDIFAAPSPFSVPQRSLFRDHYDPTLPAGWYNENLFGYQELALHNYHLIGFEELQLPNVPAGENPLQWNYRGVPAMRGRITCTACHNVHGTDVQTLRNTHPELGLFAHESYLSDLYTTISYTVADWSNTVMISPPVNCAYECHTEMGITSYWFVPGGE
jgi:hypothetical protein